MTSSVSYNEIKSCSIDVKQSMKKTMYTKKKKKLKLIIKTNEKEKVNLYKNFF